MRLDKFFASQSLASRKEVKELVKKGLVKINGIPARSSDMTITPEEDVILLNGKTISYKEHIYIMMNKPQGVVSATEDNLHATVLDLVPPELFRKGLFPAGRLDKDTVGFVLVTDDGDFAHRILSPKKHVSKTYLRFSRGFAAKRRNTLSACRTESSETRKAASGPNRHS